MAGTAHRGSRARGHSPRRASSSPSPAAARGHARGSIGSTPRKTRRPDPARLELEVLLTRTTHRQLILRGLAPDEAANVTAFMCGLPIAQVHWSLRQLNQLLFLRQLARSGRFGAADGDRPRPH